VLLFTGISYACSEMSRDAVQKVVLWNECVLTYPVCVKIQSVIEVMIFRYSKMSMSPASENSLLELSVLMENMSVTNVNRMIMND
jgi:hypothetical protein